MAYTHLAEDERYKIYHYKGRRDSLTLIAFACGQHKSTVSLELRRNRGLWVYRPIQAHACAQPRSELPRGGRRIGHKTWALCRARSSSGYSSEQAAGRCANRKSGRVSHVYLSRRVHAKCPGAVLKFRTEFKKSNLGQMRGAREPRTGGTGQASNAADGLKWTFCKTG